MDILLSLSEVMELRKGNSPVPLRCNVCKCIFHSTKTEVLSVHRGNRKKKTLNSCSRKCAMRANGAKTRSKPEIILYNMLQPICDGINIKQNDREILENGLELDIFIPGVNIAIEVNGPTHYYNIFGELRLLRTELNDLKKKDRALELGITLKILDVSKVTDKEITNIISDFLHAEVIPALKLSSD